MATIKHFVRFDSSSVPSQVLNGPVRYCEGLKSVIHHDYLMEIDPATFTHAYLLLGLNPTRYGADLSPHLVTVQDFFSKQHCAGGIALNFGTSDFKRRYSEDLGVALSTLLMVRLFGIEWSSICQIPENRKLSKKRPDFQGFDSSQQRYIYESKGTTRLDAIEKTIDKAVGQVKKYPEASLQKIAIVSYLCGSPRAFPSYSFFVDPELPDIVPPDLVHSELLHGELILRFVGCNGAAAGYLRYLSALFTLERKFAQESGPRFPGLTPPDVYDAKLSRLLDEFQQSFDREVSELQGDERPGRFYRVRRHSTNAGGSNYTISVGVAESVLAAIRAVKTPIVEPPPEQGSASGAITSYLPNGTMLVVARTEG